MKFQFAKMHGAGNDFVVTSDSACPLEKESIALICHRKYGVGSDGLIFLVKAENGVRFRFWNPDGSPAEMCGNGLRCAMEYACRHGLAADSGAQFLTDSGTLAAKRLAPGLIRIQMPDAANIQQINVCGYDCFSVTVGVPHAVIEVPDLENTDVCRLGAQLRYAPEFAPVGTNVDFVQVKDPDTLLVRTYERGVESETLACGTGVTASAVFLRHQYGGTAKKTIFCHSNDRLSVEFSENGNMLQGITLTGPAVTVFSGTMDL